VGSVAVALNGNSLTLQLPMTFTPAYAGAKNVYMFANNGTVGSGWQTRGSWTVPAPAPTVTADSVTPSSGSGSTQTFALQYSDTAGATDLLTTWVWFNATFSSTGNSCLLYYNRSSNVLYLLSDTGSAWMPATVGSATTLSNSQCSVNVGSVVVTLNVNSLTLQLPMTFTPAYAGTKNVYMFANNGTVGSGWQTRGSWTVQ
jgi:hypothetical protein